MNVMTCKHHWTIMGISVGGSHHGRLHRHCCKCEGDLYSIPSIAERKRHDPTDDLRNYSYCPKTRGFVRDLS